MRIDDETLSRYLDGEASESEVEAVRQALATSPALERRLAVLAAADERATAFFAEIDERPLPDALVKRLRSPRQGGEAGDRKGFSLHLLPRRIGDWRPPAWTVPLAASIALIIGFGAGLYGAGGPVGPVGDTAQIAQIAGAITPDHPLHDVLEATPSGRARTLATAPHLTAVPVLSFRAKDGRYCREIAVQAGGRASRSVACRSERGDWTIALMAAATPLTEDGYAPASGRAPEAIERRIDEMITGGLLDAAEESAAIDAGWAATHPQAGRD